MIINRITINNITSFRNKHVFQFNYKPGQTISLIYGENGTGKTSILQAIRIAFYGQFLFNNNKVTYQQYLDRFIRANASFASIEISFQVVTLSGQENYTIIRAWKRKITGVTETLSILKEDTEFQGVPPQFYQDFVFNIVPLGMMGLFFFDGEEINSLGESLSSGEISNAVKKLIGLSALEDLEDAVNKYQLESLQGKINYDALLQELKNLDIELSEFHKEGERLHQQYANTNEFINKFKTKLESKEITFFEVGGNLASSHGVISEKNKMLTQKIERDNAAIRELSLGYLPLCIFPEGLEELSDQLILERDAAANSIVNEYAKEKAKQLEQALTEAEASEVILKTALNILRTPEKIISEPIHDLTTKQTDEILAVIRIVNEVIRPQALKYFSEIHISRQELEMGESVIEKISDNMTLAETLSDMRALNLQLMKYERDREELLFQKKQIEKKVMASEIKKKTYLKQIERMSSESKSEELAKQFPKILDRIKNDFFERRLQALQGLVLRNVKNLFRKTQFIHDVHIASDFSIELIGQRGIAIDLRSLSAGEKQMLATAIQWALASLTNNNIPTVIDTPLARLDSYHRKTLVENYYPAISQLIILSTDEEIDKSSLSKIQHMVSDIYTLRYNKELECTNVSKIDASDVRQ